MKSTVEVSAGNEGTDEGGSGLGIAILGQRNTTKTVTAIEAQTFTEGCLRMFNLAELNCECVFFSNV